MKEPSNNPLYALASHCCFQQCGQTNGSKFLLSNLRAKEHSLDVHKSSKTESGSSIKHITASVQKYIALFVKHCAHPYVDIELPKATGLTGTSKAWRRSKYWCTCLDQVTFGRSSVC